MLPLLEKIYITVNRLRKISGIDHLKQLKTLGLSYNRIVSIEGLLGCVSLYSLGLGKCAGT